MLASFKLLVLVLLGMWWMETSIECVSGSLIIQMLEPHFTPLQYAIDRKRKSLVQPMFWPEESDNPAQLKEFEKRSRTAEELMNVLERNRKANAKHPLDPLSLSLRPGDLPTCTKRPVDMIARDQWFQLYSSRANAPGIFQKFPYTRDLEGIVCDVCTRVSSHVVGMFMTRTGLANGTVSSAIRTPELNPKEICTKLLGHIEHREAEHVSVRTSGINWKEAKATDTKQMFEEWFSTCMSMVEDFQKHDATILRLITFREMYELGKFRSLHEGLPPFGVACAMLSCCPTRQILNPFGGLLELFDEFLIIPDDIGHVMSKQSTTQLGCALSQQKILVNLEVTVDSTVSAIDVFGHRLGVNKRRILHNRDINEYTRTLRVRLDPAFHQLTPTSSHLRVRQLLAELSNVISNVVGRDVPSLTEYSIAIQDALIAETLSKNQATPENQPSQTPQEVQQKVFKAQLEKLWTMNYDTYDSQWTANQQYPSAIWPTGINVASSAPTADMVDQDTEIWRGIGRFEVWPLWQQNILDANRFPKVGRTLTFLESLLTSPADDSIEDLPRSEPSDTRFISEQETIDDDENDPGTTASATSSATTTTPAKQEDQGDDVRFEDSLWNAAKPTPTDASAAALLLFMPAFKRTRLELNTLLAQIFLLFLDANPDVTITSMPVIYDPISHASCNGNNNANVMHPELASSVPAILDIRIVKAWGVLELSSVFQTVIEVRIGSVVSFNENLIPDSPEEASVCGYVLAHRIPLNLKVSLVRQRSLNPWVTDIPEGEVGVEWWVGRKRMAGNYIPCLVLHMFSKASGLKLCDSPTATKCVVIPFQFVGIDCTDYVFDDKVECANIPFKDPAWRPGTDEDEMRISTMRVQAMQGVQGASEGFGRPAASEFCERHHMTLADNFDPSSTIAEAKDFSVYDQFGNQCLPESSSPTCTTFSEIQCQKCGGMFGVEKLTKGDHVLAKPCSREDVLFGRNGFGNCLENPFGLGRVLEIEQKRDPVSGTPVGLAFEILFDATQVKKWVPHHFVRVIDDRSPCQDAK